MNTVIEILKEIFFYFQAMVYTLLGLLIKVPDSTDGEKNPVILIPGLMGSPIVWLKLRRNLISKGYPVYTPDLSYQTAMFELSARNLEQFILERNLKDIYIIGHSAGGIIVTQMGYKGRDRIKKFFAVSSPFKGTWLALFIFFIPAGRQLIPGSSFLKNNEINFMTFPNLQCLYSRFDLMIIPGFQGRLGRVDDLEYPGLGHLNLPMSRSGVNFITEKLEFESSKEEPKKQMKKEVPAAEAVPVQKTGKSRSEMVPVKKVEAKKVSVSKPSVPKKPSKSDSVDKRAAKKVTKKSTKNNPPKRVKS